MNEFLSLNELVSSGVTTITALISLVTAIYSWKQSKEAKTNTESIEIEFKQMDLDNIEEQSKNNQLEEKQEQVVIVPVSWSLDWNIENKTYFCQKGRSFRDTEYIGFYKEGKVTYYAKYILSSFENIKNSIRNKQDEVSEFVNRQKENLDYYELSEIKEVNYPWRENGRTPVQNQQYISLSEIKK